MITSEEINTRLQRLGALRIFILNKMWEALYSESAAASEDCLKEFSDFQEGFMLTAMTVGIAVNGQEVIPKWQLHDKPAQFILENTVLDENLDNRISIKYGKTAALVFFLSQVMASIKLLAVFQYVDLTGLSSFRKTLIKDERKKANDALIGFSSLLQNNLVFLEKHLKIDTGHQFFNLLSLLGKEKKTKADYTRIDNLIEPLLNCMVPEYNLIDERLDRACQIIDRLHECEPGRAQWKIYEDICIDALNFLFVPPFKRILIQQNTEDKYERRDAIMPNNQVTGFWKHVREEFQARHIVCEFKNKSENLSKKDIEQLRLYLSNKSLGRFGLLFSRQYPSSSVLTARRLAYEQAGILILPINDRVLESLLKIRAFLGDPSDLLEDHKSKFEIEY